MDMQENQFDGFQNEPKQSNGRIWLVLFVLLVFVLCAVFYFFVQKQSNTITPKPLIITKTLPVNYHTQVIAKNKYPTGFPEKLIVKKDLKGIVNADPTWVRSEDTIVGSGKRLKIVELLYQNISPTDLAPLYEKSFKANAFIIDEKLSNNTPVVRSFTSTAETATLIITKVKDKDSLVNITLSTK